MPGAGRGKAEREVQEGVQVPPQEAARRRAQNITDDRHQVLHQGTHNREGVKTTF